MNVYFFFKHLIFIRIFVIQIIRIMLSKLTLSVDQSVIKSAKVYAKQKGKSVSELVEHYLKSLQLKAIDQEELSPKVLALMGSVSMAKTEHYKQRLSAALTKRYKS